MTSVSDEPHVTPLVAAACEVADGAPPDWELLSNAHPELRAVLRRLRFLHSLADECARPLDLDAGESLEDALTRTRPLGPDGAPPESGPDSFAAPAFPPLPFSWGPLEVRELVGSGGFGDVFRAWDSVLQREVALKLRRARATDSTTFDPHLEEARRLASVRHPHVLTVHGVAIHDGRAGIWTDFIRGRALDHVLAERGPFARADLIRIGRELCRALAAVHDAELIHGDIKTANAMLEADGRAVLMDFGAGSGSQGTPLAMAPELLAGGRPSFSSDLYALGVLLYRLATGRYPIAASTWDELLAAHAKGEMVPLAEARPDLPAPLTKAIERAMTADPATRPGHARELEWMLAASEDPEGASESDASAAEDPPGFPKYATRFIGRQREIAAIRELLLDPGLVTLVGAGGSGKTRLAHRIALESASALEGGAVWIDLSSIVEPEFVAPTLLRAIGGAEGANRASEDSIVERLRASNLLLVLDNCEHLLARCRRLAERILASCPRVRILATSREPLGVESEREVGVLSLSLPPVGDPARGEFSLAIGQSESVRLFVDRACRRRPDFVLTPELAPAVARIVRRLDGIPLAIELAAARVEALSVEQIAARLEESFRLLVDRQDGAIARQQTLRASIEWSYRLLSEPEQRLLDRLSVFVGGWTLHAAEEICRDANVETPTVQDEEVLDLLENLVSRSLVQFGDETRGGSGRPAARYRLLEMVRSFGVEQLERSGQRNAQRDRHLHYFAYHLVSDNSELHGPDQEAVFQRIDADVDNVRAALEHARTASTDLERLAFKGTRICTNLRLYWFFRGQAGEAARQVDALLARPAEPSMSRGKLLLLAGIYHGHLGETDLAVRLTQDALAMQREVGDRVSVVETVLCLGLFHSDRREFDEARACFEEALAEYRATDDPIGALSVVISLGSLARLSGDLEMAQTRYEEARRLCEVSGERATLGLVISKLGANALDQSDLSRAQALCEEAVALLRRTSHKTFLSRALCTLGELALVRDDLSGAHAVLLEALSLGGSVDSPESQTTQSVELLGWRAVRCGSPESGTRLLAAARTSREARTDPYSSVEAGRRLESIADVARAALGESRFLAAWAEGRALSIRQAARLALSQSE